MHENECISCYGGGAHLNDEGICTCEEDEILAAYSPISDPNDDMLILKHKCVKCFGPSAGISLYVEYIN
jgi:hypothetical protein